MALKKKGVAEPIEVVDVEVDEKGKIKVKGKKKKLLANKEVQL